VWSFSLEDPEEQIAREILADRIGAELREAKARYGHQNANNAPTTSRGSPPEVLLPAGLLHSIAGDILHASRDEPCGVRYLFRTLIREDVANLTNLFPGAVSYTSITKSPANGRVGSELLNATRTQSTPSNCT
jgi:hypothetical protein